MSIDRFGPASRAKAAGSRMLVLAPRAKFLTLFGAALIAGPIACANSFTDPDPAANPCEPCDATIQSVRSIFRSSCSGPECHGAEEAAAALDLRSDGVGARLIGVTSGACDPPATLVVPGDPEASLLYQKLLGTAHCGDPMPIDRKLCDENISCVREWIANVAAVTDGGTDAGPAVCEGVDLGSDPNNCGACGNVCGPLATCAGGVCQCPPGTDPCAGGCADTTSDPAHCGGCGIACAPTEVCLGSACASGCGTLTQCGQSCVDTQTSLSNCGSCNTACPLGQTCTAGACACPGGLSACSTGCFDFATSLGNCGSCNNVCGAGQSCMAGVCACPGGLSPCPPGCFDLASDVANCGACGNACSPGLVCAAGNCECVVSGTVSLSANIQPIFTANCTNRGCHGGVRPAGELDLTAGRSYAELVNVASSQCMGGKRLVVPGDPAQSYIMNKLTGLGMCYGTQMPKVGVRLPPAQLDAISSWICSGAPNN